MKPNLMIGGAIIVLALQRIATAARAGDQDAITARLDAQHDLF